MTTSSPWCCGYRRPPHVPDGALVVIDHARGAQLCQQDCWTRWVRDDRKVQR